MSPNTETHERTLLLQRQRRRRISLVQRAHQLSGVGGFDVAFILYQKATKRFYSYSSDDRTTWPPLMSDIVSDTPDLVSIVDKNWRYQTPNRRIYWEATSILSQQTKLYKRAQNGAEPLPQMLRPPNRLVRQTLTKLQWPMARVKGTSWWKWEFRPGLNEENQLG